MNPIDFEKKFIHQFKNPPEGEQELIRSFFKNKPKGFYVDVGANEPVIESQTYHLEKEGWDGLLIEPLPYYIKLLKEQRRGKVVPYACSSPENHNKEHEIIVAGGHSTLNNDPIAIGTVKQDTAMITCRTLDSVLEENKVIVGFEFISIDIEGHEMEMFKGFTLTKWKPQLVLLEDHVINHEKHNHMVKNGYQLILRTGLNSWYVPATNKHYLSFASRLEVLRKYWLGLCFRKIRYSR